MRSPENDLATGIYVDQRATRVWLQQQLRARQQNRQRTRVINLFAYTGIFHAQLWRLAPSTLRH